MSNPSIIQILKIVEDSFSNGWEEVKFSWINETVD